MPPKINTNNRQPMQLEAGDFLASPTRESTYSRHHQAPATRGQLSEVNTRRTSRTSNGDKHSVCCNVSCTGRKKNVLITLGFVVFILAIFAILVYIWFTVWTGPPAAQFQVATPQQEAEESMVNILNSITAVF